jgi:hypothetical protein
MKPFLILIGIIILLLMILLSLDKTRNLQEAFGVLPVSNQSSYISSDIPGAVTTNPTIAKPTNKEIIDAKDTLRTFSDLCQTNGNQISVTDKQTFLNLKYRAPIFMNELNALEANPDIIDASHFYTTWNNYKQAIQILKQKPIVEGFAVTANSIKQDAANLLDAISIFEETYAAKDIEKINLANDRNFVNDLHASAERNSVNIRRSSLPTDTALAQRIQLQTADYQRGLLILNGLPNKVLTNNTSSGSATNDKITLQGIKDLIANIQAEQLRLDNLRSSDPNTLTRIRLLEQLLADLRKIVQKVESNEMNESEIPIKASDATNFLAQYKNTDTLPYLMEQSGTTDSSFLGESNAFAQPHNFTSGTEVTSVPTLGSGGPMIPAELLKYLSNMKWTMKIKIHNDPGIAYRERTMNRIKELEQRIAAYAYNDIPIPKVLQFAFKRELEALSNSITDDYAASDEMPTSYTENPVQTYMWSDNTRMPADERLNNLADYNPFSRKDNSNPDAMYRPGFIMNDETIKRRGSASAFDDSVVGGPDYKQRSKDLCRQIKSAQLGEPTTFGCIENQDEVSASYSWKGNFQMICNRLGDTWGGWYPEMFGCPKYDPTMKYDGANF